MYEANLSIYCVDGATEGIISSDPKRLMKFLTDRDHEGSYVTMTVRDHPDDDPFREVNDPGEVYRELENLCK